jgi:O-antigen ligase
VRSAPSSAVRSRPARRSPAEQWGRRLVAFILIVWASSFVIGFESSLIILTVTGLCAAIAGVWRPALGLLGMVILCTLDSVARAYLLTGGLWRYNTFNYWFLVVMVISLPFLLGLRDRPTRLLQWFLLLLTVGLIFSPDLSNGMQHILNLATIFGLLAYFARGAKQPDDWYWMAVVAGILGAVGSLCFYLQQEGLPRINPNSWSFLPLTAIFALNLGFPATRSRGRGQILLALLAAVNGAWVFLSTSRGSFLIACVCLTALVIQLRRMRRGVVPIILALLVVLTILSQFRAKEAVAVGRFARLFDTERSLASRTSGRSAIALTGWRMFLDNPLGVGTGGFGKARFVLGTSLDPSDVKEGVYLQAHSGWIKVLVENGVPGIILFTAFVTSFAFMGWKMRNRELFLLGVLVTLTLSVAFIADEFQGKGLWLLTAGVMTVLRRAAMAGRGRRMEHPTSVRAPRSARLGAISERSHPKPAVRLV